MSEKSSRDTLLKRIEEDLAVKDRPYGTNSQSEGVSRRAIALGQHMIANSAPSRQLSAALTHIEQAVAIWERAPKE